MTLRQTPFETSYPRWRHKKLGYVVKILGVQNFRGDLGYFSFVEIEGTKHNAKLKTFLSSEVLKRDFEPTGRKKKAKSAADRLLDDE